MRIIIEGDFFDCQIIRDRIFLWDTYGWLDILDFRNAIYDLAKEYKNNFEFIIQKEAVHAYVIASLRMIGGIFPIDSVYMGNHLYTATESGLYQRYIPKGRRIVDLPKGRVKKLTDLRFKELSARPGMLAMAGASEGLFELYDPNKYRITKSGHRVIPVGKGIYSVSRSYSKVAWYDAQDIISINKDGNLKRYIFNSSSKVDSSGKILRNYIKQDVIGGHSHPRLPPPSRLYDDLREVYVWKLVREGGDHEYHFAMRNFKEPVVIASKPRRFLFGHFGMAAESRKELVVVHNDSSVVRVEGPITRSRIVSGFGKKNGLLVIVSNDNVTITDCND